MDLERLKEFSVIAKEASFQRAAAQLQIPPSVLSARFQVFEKSLGIRLLERNNHYVRPTAKGAVILEHARDLLSSWEEVVSGTVAMKEEASSSLAIELCAHNLPSELGPFLDLYCRRHPRLFLNLYDENFCELREGLSLEKTDIVFAPGLENDYLDISGRIPLARFPNLHVHVANDHPLADRSGIRFSDLEGETLILYPRMKDPFVRELQLRLLSKAPFSFKICEENSSPYFQELLVPIGRGVRLFNWSSQLAPNSRMIPVEDKGYDTWLYLLYKKESANPVTEMFIREFLAFRGNRK